MLRHVVVDSIVTSGQEILLIKRAEHTSNGGKWGMPGGYVELNETIEQAVARELKEETNLNAKSIKFFKIIDNPLRKNDDRQNVAFVHMVSAEGELIAQKGEVDELKWFKFNEIPAESDFAFDHFQIIQDYLLQHRSG